MSCIGNKEIMARNLRRYIEASGMQQKEIAHAIGVAPSTLNNWTQGTKYPRIDKIELLADYFGILKSDLIEDKKSQYVEYDKLAENQRLLMDFVSSVPEDKAAMILKVIRSIVEDD